MAGRVRAFRWPLFLLAVASACLGVWVLAQPFPVFTNDLPGFVLLAGGVIGAFVVLAQGRRAWLCWPIGIHAGIVAAVLYLAYKDAPLEEAKARGAMIVVDVLLHVLLAPVEILIGGSVGFVDNSAPVIVLVCAALGLLGGELVRRRMWPRAAGVSASHVSQ